MAVRPERLAEKRSERRAEDRGLSQIAAPVLIDRLRVEPGVSVDFAAIDPRDTYGWTKRDAQQALGAASARLSDLQERIWAEHEHAVLIVLQGLDASGKDGTIRRVMGAFDPLGCPVTSFGVPTEVELAHDYLWRIHQRTPAKGEIGVFNRSHYEDVLVVRVNELVPESVWRPRYAQINHFERLLSEAGTTIVKLYLLVSREEQRERLQARVDDPTKRWKFRLGDLDERRRWDEHVIAAEEALSRCSTPAAPWYVIPADRKWFRDLAVAEILAATLEALDPRYPEPKEDLSGVVVE